MFKRAWISVVCSVVAHAMQRQVYKYVCGSWWGCFVPPSPFFSDLMIVLCYETHHILVTVNSFAYRPPDHIWPATWSCR